MTGVTGNHRLWIEAPVGAQAWLRSKTGDVPSCQGFSKPILVFWEEPAAIPTVLSQEDGVCTAHLVQHIQRTFSLAELSLDKLPGEAVVQELSGLG